MYKAHQGATLIPVEMNAPEYRFGQASIPSLDASASRDKAGRLHLSLVNLNPNQPAQVLVRVVGATPKTLTGRLLTAPMMNDVNTFARPDAVSPVQFKGVAIQGGAITLSLPPKSVVMLEF
jgi:alpha-N-arabinofuranosidase